MSSKGFKFKLMFEDEKIVDQKVNNVKELNSLFKDVKLKFGSK